MPTVSIYALLKDNSSDYYVEFLDLLHSSTGIENERISVSCDNENDKKLRSKLDSLGYASFSAQKSKSVIFCQPSNSKQMMLKQLSTMTLQEPWTLVLDSSIEFTSKNWLVEALNFTKQSSHLGFGQILTGAWENHQWDEISGSSWFRGRPACAIVNGKRAVKLVHGSYIWSQKSIMESFRSSPLFKTVSSIEHILAEIANQAGSSFRHFSSGITLNKRIYNSTVFNIQTHQQGQNGKKVVVKTPFQKAEERRENRKAIRSKTIIKHFVWLYHDFEYGNSLSHVSRETVRWLSKQGYSARAMTWDGLYNPKSIVRYGINVSPPTQDEIKNSAIVAMSRWRPPEHILCTLRDTVPFLASYWMLEGTKANEWDVRWLEEWFDAVFTPSEFCKKSLIDSGIRIPVFVWHHGYDHEVLKYVEKTQNRPFTFLWHGDENRRKGYDLFLEAFKRVKNPNVRAWIHGPGRGAISNLNSKYKGDSRIMWDTGVVAPDDLRKIASESDVIVLPLRSEGFGLTPLEMMACGLPAIMTKHSGVLDFGGADDITYWLSVSSWESAQNDSGVQASPSLEELISIMERCASNPDEVRERGKRACRSVQNWTWQKKVTDVIPILEKFAPNVSLKS